ncbi:MAG: tetratricopeptide repeat protein [Desulfuromonadales bacterium]|nr:tetratricopeptide repeat protein [Desulfuromonadales bacterium]
MMQRALAALALGGFLLLPFPDYSFSLEATPAANKTPDIIQRYHEALATDPGNLTLHYLLGVALLKKDRNKEALAELQMAYPAYQNSIEAHYNLAIASLRLDDLTSAEIYLDQAIALGAESMQGIYPIAGLYFNMALSSQNGGNPNEAIRYFHKVLQINPGHYEVHRQLGDLYAQQSDINLAINSFRTYLQQFPDDPVSRDYLFALTFNRAQDYLAAEDLDKAKAGFMTALELQPDSPTALYYLGYIAYAQQQPLLAATNLTHAFRTAEETLQQTIRPLLYNTAVTLWKSGNLIKSLEAVSIMADQKQALFNELFLAGTLNMELGQYRSAHQYLLRAIASNPQDSGARQNLIATAIGAFREWLTLAKLKLQDDDFDAAMLALQSANKLQPDSPEVLTLISKVNQTRLNKASAHFFKSQAALDAGDIASASEHVTAGLQIQPDNSDGIALREEVSKAMSANLEQLNEEATLDMQTGDLDTADQIYARILDISPSHPEALSGRQQIAAQRLQRTASLLAQGQQAINSGQPALAIKLFNELLSLTPENAEASQGLNSALQMQANRLDELLVKGRQALGRDRYKEAREWFEQAREIDTTQRSRLELEKLTEEISRQAEELTDQANLALSKGTFREAGKLYRKALAALPDYEPAKTGQDKLAKQIESTISSKLQEAGRAIQELDYVKAMDLYRAVLDINPDHGDALAGMNKGRQGQAEKLEQLVRQGEMALNNGDLESARSHISAALDQDAYHKQAQQLRQRLDLMEQTGAQPGDEQKLYLQGVAYYTQGKYEDAIKSWETVLLLNPAHDKASENITKTRYKMQQIREYSGE